MPSFRVRNRRARDLLGERRLLAAVNSVYER